MQDCRNEDGPQTLIMIGCSVHDACKLIKNNETAGYCSFVFSFDPEYSCMKNKYENPDSLWDD